MLIGYARCSTLGQDVASQREQLLFLGVEDTNIIVDNGYSAANRNRPGLKRTLDKARAGDVLVVTKLDPTH